MRVICWRKKRVKRNIKFLLHDHAMDEIKVLRFFMPKYTSWEAYVVGVDFSRKDIRNVHLTGGGTQCEWVNPRLFLKGVSNGS